MSEITNPLPKIPESVLNAFALHSETAPSLLALADIAGITLDQLVGYMGDPLALRELESYRNRAIATGKHRPILAGLALDKAVARIAQELPNADGFESAELAKPLMRIIELSEKIRLAERTPDGNEGLTTFQFIFNNGSVQLIPQPLANQEVIDVASKAVS